MKKLKRTIMMMTKLLCLYKHKWKFSCINAEGEKVFKCGRNGCKAIFIVGIGII